VIIFLIFSLLLIRFGYLYFQELIPQYSTYFLAVAALYLTLVTGYYTQNCQYLLFSACE